MNLPLYIVGHHSDIPHDGKPQLQRIENGHRAQRFPKSKMGFHIGYHIVIEEDGSWQQVRGFDERGAHAVNCGCKIDVTKLAWSLLNYKSIGICLAGRFQEHPPTAAQITTLHRIILELEWRFGISRSRFILHRETKPTACPVANLRELVEEEHRLYLALELSKSQNALKWAKPTRKAMLLRKIARLFNILYPSPS